MNFISVDEFKEAIGVTSFKRVLNSNNGKYSLLAGKAFYKVQQDLDPSLEMAFMFEDVLEEGCLVNVDRTSPLETLDIF